MAGQIVKRGEKVWIVRIFQGRDENGKRRYINKTIHGTKKSAEKYLTAKLRDKDLGINIEPMGGHGALIVGLRNPDAYRSISAFAPISSTSRSAWGKEALTAYLGGDETAWGDYDASAVIQRAPTRHRLLVDQGAADPFLDQLRPQDLRAACEVAGQALSYNERDGYDHGYFFVSTFIESHLAFHANALGA
jgi:S-formylglutathione hydrolase